MPDVVIKVHGFAQIGVDPIILVYGPFVMVESALEPQELTLEKKGTEAYTPLHTMLLLSPFSLAPCN